MTEVIKLGKKAFTFGVVASTILWSVGAAALVPAVAHAEDLCPALQAGDMIKVVGVKTIYSINNDTEVIPFTDGYAFKTWNVGETYAGLYKSISQDCYESLRTVSSKPLFVGYRPGSAVLQREGSYKLFVVLPNNVKAEISLDAAKALYGNSFVAMKVMNEHWDSVYTTDAPMITEAKAHDGMLVKKDSKTYYVSGGQLVEVTAEGLSANRVKASYVRALSASATEGMAVSASKIEGYSVALADRTQTGVSGSSAPVVPSTPSAQGATTVSLAADQPVAATIVSDTTNGGQALAAVLKLNFTAPSDGDAKVTSLKIKRSGISADTDISNMYIYDGDVRLSANPSVSTNYLTFTNSAGLFSVSKGSTKSVTVKFDLKTNTSAGKTLAFSVASSSDVSVASGSVAGNFPLIGNTFTTASITDLGKLVISNVSPAAAGTVDPGTTGYEIWRFQLANTAQDIEVRRLAITIVGSVNIDDLKNFTLSDGATQVGSVIAGMASDKTVVFDLSSSPLVVTKGQTKILSLKADILSGTNRTFRASLQNAADFVTFDKSYGVYLKANGTDAFSIVEPTDGTNAVNFTVNAGTLTQSLSADSPTGNIPDASTNVVLAKFSWKANGEDVKISSVSVSSTAAGTTSDKLANVRLLVNGSQVGTTITSLTMSGAASTGFGTFGNSFIIKAGTSADVQVVADTTDATLAGEETIVVGLSAGSSNAQGLSSLGSISTVAQNANQVTVKTGTVSLGVNTGFGNKSASNPTGPVNASASKVASLIITAGAGEAADLSQITLTETAGTCIGTYMQNLTLKNASGVQLGATYANPSASCVAANSYTFNISPAVTIPAGGQYVVDVFADLKSAYTAGGSLIKADAITATGHDTGTSASLTGQGLALQNQYISSAGNLMVEVDSDTPVAANYLLGATDQTLAKFKVTASSTEDVNLSQLVISAVLPTANTTGTLKNLKLVDAETGVQLSQTVAALSSPSPSATSTFAHAGFGFSGLKITKGTSKVFVLKADISTYEDLGLSTTGQTVAPMVMTAYTSTGANPVIATGASSGSSITATVSSAGSVNTFRPWTSQSGFTAPTSTFYRAKLTTAWASDTPSGAASPSASQTVAKFVVTNLANSGSYAATVSYVNFDMSTTVSNTANRTLTVYKDSLSTTAVGSTSFLSAGVQNFGDTAFTSWTSSVEVSSGASKTFYVTLDTTNAVSAKTLSIRIGSSDVVWTDGVSTGLTAMGADLPLVWKTFTY